MLKVFGSNPTRGIVNGKEHEDGKEEERKEGEEGEEEASSIANSRNQRKGASRPQRASSSWPAEQPGLHWPRRS